jgi:ribosomal-protein-alanine N-acetyltransferase
MSQLLRACLPIEGERLSLRLFTLEDAEALYKLHSDPLLTRYAGGLKTQEESYASLKRIVAKTCETGFGALAVVHRESGEIVGWCGVQLMHDNVRYEVIYALSPTMWGQGYALEAASLVISAALRLDAFAADAMHGLVFPQNARSIRVLEKLGMRHIGDVFDDASQRYASLYRVSRGAFVAGPWFQRSSSK